MVLHVLQSKKVGVTAEDGKLSDRSETEENKQDLETRGRQNTDTTL